MRHAISILAAAFSLAIAIPADAHQAVDKRLQKLIPDKPETEIKDKPGRIKKGRDLFLHETFGGNGRTCGTCHMPTESFALSPEDIAARPANDPLFVAETNPSLKNLENPTLMHGFGLILENLDGFDKPGVMRGVPHTLALPTSITPPPGFPLKNATGWSGDGAPFDGDICQFAFGAIVQHFTKDLLRRPGTDFRVPSKQELRDMCDFQLSLGRRNDVSLDGDNGPALVFADPAVESGKALFITTPRRNGPGSCAACHDEAGANTQAGVNQSFDTGTRRRPTAPACRGDAPGDGGFLFGQVTTDTIHCADGRTINATFRGDGKFNTPPLIEAADTAPFFHNNSAATLEEAIVHYTTTAFVESPSGANNPFVLDTTQINQISALLRTLNARENAINSSRVDKRALREGNVDQVASIREALSETDDAIKVLTESPVPIYQNSTIISLLQQARTNEQKALTEKSPGQRNPFLATAVTQKQQAVAQFTQ